MTQDALVGGLVVTHGQLGQELVAAAETIVGETLPIVAVSIGWNDDVAESQKKIEVAVQKVDTGRGVIILTDMFGGTPCVQAQLTFDSKGGSNHSPKSSLAIEMCF